MAERSGRARPARLRAIAAGVLALLLAAGCDPSAQAPHRSQFHAFGTTINVTLHGVSASKAALLSGRLQQHFDDWQRRWSPWAGEGLAALNAALGQGEAAEVAPELSKLLARARAITLASDGLFDPGMGALVRLWGLDDDDAPAGWEPPPGQAIAKWLEVAPSLAELNIVGTTVSAPEGVTSLQIDLGAFAKGMALDRAIDLLRKAGVPAALIDAGGDLAVLGTPGGRPWRIGLRATDSDSVLATITLQNGEAAFTAGDYARYVTDGDRRFHHILDPATGRPAEGTRAVTVIHRDAALAGAAAAALFVAGPERWHETAQALGVERVLLVGGDGRLHLSEPMVERASIVRDPAPPIMVAEGQ